MRVYRGPSTTPLGHESHEFVATVSSEDLEDGIRKGGQIRFNVTKEGHVRNSVCTIQFDDKDIIPLIRGLIPRLHAQQQKIDDLSMVLKGPGTDAQKIAMLQAIAAR